MVACVSVCVCVCVSVCVCSAHTCDGIEPGVSATYDVACMNVRCMHVYIYICTHKCTHTNTHQHTYTHMHLLAFISDKSYFYIQYVTHTLHVYIRHTHAICLCVSI